MENIIDRENIHAAVLAVERNKGAPGIDGLTTLQLRLLLSLDPEIFDFVRVLLNLEF
ncbi:MAG: hypothetical protein RL095_3602 [Verrucomicrobiota bacterium]